MRLHLWLRRVKHLLLLSSFQPLCAAASSNVKVALKASFDAAPLLVELLETAAEENATAYYPLLDRVAEGYFDGDTTDQKLYTHFTELLKSDGHVTNPDVLDSFKFALSIHSTAPRIEAQYQFYNTSVEARLAQSQDTKCENLLEYSGAYHCSPDVEIGAGKEKGILEATPLLPFDRVLGDDSIGIPSILYADLTSLAFRRFHQTLSRAAREGKTSYRVRYKPSSVGAASPLVVNGYGVELALKRTDYIVIDDRDAEQDAQKETEGAKSEGGLEWEETANIKPLSASEMALLGVKASSFVLDSENPLDTLLKLTQDFPKHAASISTHNASEAFLEEHHANRIMALPAGFNALWINGVQVAARDIDAFSLLEILRKERTLVNDIKKLGFQAKDVINILSHDAVAEAQMDEDVARYDFRDEIEGGNVMIWLNDIEKDKRYEDWPSDPQALLQRTFPGQLPTVRRDIHNFILPMDFSDIKDVETTVENIQGFVKRGVPIRFGLVPITKTTPATLQARTVYHLLDTYGLAAAMTYLQGSAKSKKLSTPHEPSFAAAIKGRKLRRDREALSLLAVTEAGDLEARLDGARNYLVRLGADSSDAPYFANGVAIPRNDEWLQGMSQRITADLRDIQQNVYQGTLADDTWFPSHFLAGASVRRNALVIPEDPKNIKLVNLAKLHDEHGNAMDALPSLDVEQDSSKEWWARLVVVGDFGTKAGADLANGATQLRKEHKYLHVTFVHNSEIDPSAGNLATLIAGAATSNAKLDVSIMEENIAESASERVVPAVISDYAVNFWKPAKQVVKALGLEPGQSGILLNGRLVGPIPKTMPFAKEDLDTLFEYENKKRVIPSAAAVKALELLDKVDTSLTAAKLSSLVAISTVSDVPEGIFENPSTFRTDAFNKWASGNSAITTGDLDTATIQIVASLDPSTENAQRWVPILKVLSELSGTHLRLWINPRERIDELPVKRFYRYVLQPEPSFDESGALQDQSAVFSGLPSEILLTMGMDVPPSWLVAPKESVHDLDNIKLSTIAGHADVEAMYELENILIEGHSRDLTAGVPPRGAQLILRTEKDPHFADTLIMSNLGYFQFKANPGYYNIELAAGRSKDIFNIDSVGAKGYNAQPGDESTEVTMLSFKGVTLFPRVSRKVGMEDEDVLETAKSTAEDIADHLLEKAGVKSGTAGKYLNEGLKLGSKLLSKTGLSTEGKSRSQADINIFSVASGHLYERMLNIMMLSVMKHTKHTVKFWFIEQFLSPSFKSFLPTMAAAYGFDYEMVTYKWPHWLRAQKEKQRVIWGYKILFLDVLFPLDLDKVIFVDADQIVRTDMYDLVQHDLKGAPYGFTPMCDSRTEMEGFRFWKVGYWKNFLKGLPYHISALYVVDLKRFRAIAAGDRLRQQYHQLSADPNSLSNLDQDLPNNMQMVLPIHSLPQEWLWCETWCSDESLAKAKTIDLCNNPQTKEPKLDRARRQVPEWTVYDDEIAALARKNKSKGDGTANMVKGGEDSTATERPVAKSEDGRPRDEL
ncbi:glycosyltransferase family 24 protein [Aulographum hederae CBS 113979]|uniref:Glycosyltransferase family 24 protein n=1 Tax=Aulographum hederae CBS 113979 TaxID=1176131 RepID=A0A6G1GXB4_9PEZI|nr:glycosyltransferase family 24 protein [Aulographum hederae CBS 113979]